jgi:hypothetical protein
MFIAQHTMAEIISHLINPLKCTNPHVPLDAESYPIHPISNVPIATIPSVFVFPGEIDLDRLVLAIQSLSRSWPNLFGRYEKLEHPHPDHGGLYQVCPLFDLSNTRLI